MHNEMLPYLNMNSAEQPTSPAVVARQFLRDIFKRPCDASETEHSWVIPDFLTNFIQGAACPNSELLIQLSNSYHCTCLKMQTYFSLTRQNGNINIGAFINKQNLPKERPGQVRFMFVMKGGNSLRKCNIDIDLTGNSDQSITNAAYTSTQVLCTLEQSLDFVKGTELRLLFRATFLDDAYHHAYHLERLDEKLCEDMENLLISGMYSDVAIQTRDGQKFQVHKAILCARNNYFATMFSHTTLNESLNSVIFIEDFDGPIIFEMLRYIYTGQVFNIDSKANILITAADKYGIDHLREWCEYVLGNIINVRNVLNMLVTAASSNAEHLLDTALVYTICYANVVFKNKTIEQIKKSLMCVPVNRQACVFADVMDTINSYTKREKNRPLQQQKLTYIAMKYPKTWWYISGLKQFNIKTTC